MENPTRLSVSYSMGLCFSADSGLLAWGEKQGVTLRLWDLVHARPHPVPPAARLIQSSRSVAFHPKSNHLVFIGPSLVPECWDVVAGQRAISFGGKEPARGSEADLSGALVREGGIGWGSTIALSADGIWLAQAGSSVRIWDLDKKELLLVLPEERSQPWCLAWSPDRSQLAVASSDGSLVIWNMPKIRLQLAEVDWQISKTASARPPPSNTHRPGISPALGLRAWGDDLSMITQTGLAENRGAYATPLAKITRRSDHVSSQRVEPPAEP